MLYNFAPLRGSPSSAADIRADALHHFKKIEDAEAMIRKWLLVAPNPGVR